MKKKLSYFMVLLLVIFGNSAFVYGADTLHVQLGPEPCPPNIPHPTPARLQIASGDYVRFHTSASCDFWVRGPDPIGEFRLGIETGETESVVGPFTEKLTEWDYWVIDGAAENDSASGTVFIPTGPTLTEWGMVILVVLILGSGIFIMLRRRKATVPA